MKKLLVKSIACFLCGVCLLTAGASAAQTGAAASGSGSSRAASSAASKSSAKASKEVAVEYIGASAEELVEAIGEPESKEYASSCIGDGEDGIWYYDGFTVYTYRDTDGSERVEDVF